MKGLVYNLTHVNLFDIKISYLGAGHSQTGDNNKFFFSLYTQ